MDGALNSKLPDSRDSKIKLFDHEKFEKIMIELESPLQVFPLSRLPNCFVQIVYTPVDNFEGNENYGKTFLSKIGH